MCYLETTSSLHTSRMKATEIFRDAQFHTIVCISKIFMKVCLSSLSSLLKWTCNSFILSSILSISTHAWTVEVLHSSKFCRPKYFDDTSHYSPSTALSLLQCPFHNIHIFIFHHEFFLPFACLSYSC